VSTLSRNVLPPVFRLLLSNVLSIVAATSDGYISPKLLLVRFATGVAPRQHCMYQIVGGWQKTRLARQFGVTVTGYFHAHSRLRMGLRQLSLL